MVVGIWSPNEDIAMSMLFALLLFFTLSGGLLVNITHGTMPDWLRWVQYISVLRYGYESLLVNMFHGVSFDCMQYVNETQSPTSTTSPASPLQLLEPLVPHALALPPSASPAAPLSA